MVKGKIKELTKRTSAVGIREKLLFWLLLIALLPMVMIGVVSYNLSSRSLERQSFEGLESTLTLQKQSLEDYFSERLKNLKNLGDDIQMLQQQEFSKISAVRTLKKNQLETLFQDNFKLIRSFASSPQLQEAIVGTAAVRKKNSSFYASWQKKYHFNSLMMIDTKGRVIYSNDDAVKVGISLQDKANTPELTAFKKGMKDVSFTDFGLSSLRNNVPTGYFSAPVIKSKRVKGVILLRLKNDFFDEILNDIVGLGETSEAYLVGPDGMFRSNSKYIDEPTLLNPNFLVDTESFAEALADITDERVLINYRGDYVFSSYTPFTAAGLTWALIVELNQSKAMILKQKGKELDYLSAYADNYGYPDLYLINPDGYIFYSTKHLADYQTNITTGLYGKSSFATIVNDVMDSKATVVSDYSRYQPAGDKPSAFIAMPLLQDDDIESIIALRLPINQVNDIMRKHGGLGETGDSYLVGADKLWRTETLQTEKYNVKSTLLNPKIAVDTKPVREALAGESGIGNTRNAKGDKVLASWAPFNFHGLQWAIINEVSQAEISKPVTRLLIVISLLAAAGIAVVLLFSFLVSGGITRQVGEIMGAISKVEKGDYNSQAQVISKDELGVMASSFNKMINTTKSLIRTRQVEHNQLQKSIMGLLEEISELAEGDMTVRATVREDVTGTVADSLNMMLEEFGGTIRKIKKQSEQVGSTVNQLRSTTDKLAIRSDSQSKLIRGTVGEINQMTQAIEQSVAKANQSAKISELSRTAAGEGTRAVENTSRAMEAIRSNIQDTARAIKRLGESSQEISDFAKTINEIADRTSILALNASIQSSAAGEEGRGFAVIAEEIQRLAERSTGSTRQIETLIRNILSEITEASASMDSSIQEVVRGTALSEDALVKLMDINKRSAEVAEMIGSVSLAAGEQAKKSVQMARAMDKIGGISIETAEATRTTSSSMRDMAATANDMLQSVSLFKLTKEGEEKEPVKG